MKALFIIGIALLFNFALFGQSDNANNQKEQVSEMMIDFEEPPIFPGGDDSMRAFIAKKVEYPKLAIENKIEGKVYIRFVVSKSGYVNGISVLRGIHPLLDSAAVAVFRKMPQWKPGIYSGKKTDVPYSLPVIFKLPENSKK